MDAYLGIVIEQSLSDPAAAAAFDVRARRRPVSWDFLLVAVPANALDEHLRALQNAMRSDEPWYAHYFRDDQLIVAFKDAVISVGVDPSTWEPAVGHGLARGVPRKQLDFKPRTEAGARAFFNIAEEVSLS